MKIGFFGNFVEMERLFRAHHRKTNLNLVEKYVYMFMELLYDVILCLLSAICFQ